MAQITYRANLSAKSFPFLSQNWGRTVIVPQYDNTFNRQVTSPADPDSDVGIPQIYYCHNVMPHQQGFQSVGYTLTAGDAVGTSNPDEIFFKMLPINTGVPTREYLMIGPEFLYALKSDNTWDYVSRTYTPTDTDWDAYIAEVSGVVYFYERWDSIFSSTNVYDPVAHTITGTSFTALPATGILGITSAFGYLIAWSANTVYWSSTIDPTDFTPSLTTGAGSGSVEALKGDIVTIVPHLQGFIIYGKGNIVAAIYSGNSRYPFNFRELPSSGGLTSSDLVCVDGSSGNHYAYTTSGLQLISSSQCQIVLPEVTDFIGGKTYEDFDETVNVFNVIEVSTPLKKRLISAADRYLIISYGMTSFTYALVYDLITKRWGKLKINHSLTYDSASTVTQTDEVPRQSISFIQRLGKIYTADLTKPSTSASGVILLGKYQFVRQRLLQLDELAIENIPVGATFSCAVFTSLDGKNPSIVTPSLVTSSGLFRKYGCRAIGINHSILLKGVFTLTSLELTFNIHGKR